jgi:hypothetical protein
MSSEDFEVYASIERKVAARQASNGDKNPCVLVRGYHRGAGYGSYPTGEDDIVEGSQQIAGDADILMSTPVNSISEAIYASTHKTMDRLRL